MQTFIIQRSTARIVLGLLLMAATFLLVSFVKKQNETPGVVNNATTGKKVNVKIYPNPSPNGTLYINCDANTDTQLYFYVFDLEGTLMHNLKMKGKDKKIITGLKKGIYMYDVFNNDESIERGKIIVK